MHQNHIANVISFFSSKFSNIKIFWKVKNGDVNCGTWWIYVQKINFISNAIFIVNHLWCKSNPIIPIFICYHQPFLWWWCKLIEDNATLYKLGFFFYYNQNIYTKYSIIEIIENVEILVDKQLFEYARLKDRLSKIQIASWGSQFH